MGYKQPSNPMKMMKSALKMHKAEKKSGMHRESAMYMGHSPMERESRELKDMPIVDIEKGDAKADRSYSGNQPDLKKYKAEKAKKKGASKKVGHREYGSPAKAAKPDYIDIDKDGNTTESMKDAAKGSPAKKQGYNDRLDESLAKDGKESSKKQSMKDRRDESKGMKKSKGKGAYSSDPKMS